MGKVEGKVCSQEVRKSSMSAAASKKLSVLKALGRKAEGESMIESLNVVVRRLVYSPIRYHNREPFETRSLMLEDDLACSSP